MSEIRATTISNAAGTGPITLTAQSAAKAWINLDQTGTAAIEDSFNFSSITDNGVGNFTTTFSNAMSNVNYSMTGSVNNTAAFFVPSIGIRGDTGILKYVGSYHSLTSKHDAVVDCEEACMAIHGDLA